ncbi:MAG TPA: DUF4190 domain-containing protein [Polyangiaceae bacterium]|jgi:hypothetical protein
MLATNDPPMVSALAVSSLIFSVLSFTCLWGAGGLLGAAFGFAAFRAIRSSNGAKSGTGLATAGVVLGVANLGACLLAVVAFWFWWGHKPLPPTPTPTKASGSRPAPIGRRQRLDSSRPPRPSALEQKPIETWVGKVLLVDIPEGSQPLSSIVHEQRTLAEGAGEKLVLWLVAEECDPCDRMAKALPDRRMQHALAGVRLVRLNVGYYAAALQSLKLPEKIPGFVLLGPEETPIDYVHGGEWDEDIAPNIAPILGRFVRGTYKKRRDPWRGGEHSDETML